MIQQYAAAVSIRLLDFLICCEEKKSDSGSYFHSPYNFPNPSNTEEHYEDALVRTLYFANLCGQLNLFLISHIFFLIERYLVLADKEDLALS